MFYCTGMSWIFPGAHHHHQPRCGTTSQHCHQHHTTSTQPHRCSKSQERCCCQHDTNTPNIQWCCHHVQWWCFTIRTLHQVILSMNWYYSVPVHVWYLNIIARLWNGSFYVWACLKKVQNVNRTTKLGPVHIQVSVHVWTEPNYLWAISMFGYWHMLSGVCNLHCQFQSRLGNGWPTSAKHFPCSACCQNLIKSICIPTQILLWNFLELGIIGLAIPIPQLEFGGGMDCG